MRTLKKRRNAKGETLIETLSAIAIFSLSAMLLAGATVSASSINLKIEENDKTYRSNLKSVENQESYRAGEIKILKNGTVSYTYDVNYYGDLDGMASYEMIAEGA